MNLTTKQLATYMSDMFARHAFALLSLLLLFTVFFSLQYLLVQGIFIG